MFLRICEQFTSQSGLLQLQKSILVVGVDCVSVYHSVSHFYLAPSPIILGCSLQYKPFLTVLLDIQLILWQKSASVVGIGSVSVITLIKMIMRTNIFFIFKYSTSIVEIKLYKGQAVKIFNLLSDNVYCLLYNN